MATFGKTSIGASGDFQFPLHATKFTTPSGGTATQITAYLGSFTTTNWRFAIYSESSGVPGSKLVESSEVVANTGGDWISTSISLALSGSTIYWLACMGSNTDARSYYDTGASHCTSNATGTWPDDYGTWPSTWSELSFSDREYSIYVTYTESGGGGGQNMFYRRRRYFDFGKMKSPLIHKPTDRDIQLVSRSKAA